MKDVVIEEIVKELNWKERIVVRLFRKTFCEIYKEGIRRGFNWGSIVR